ncbi:uncharacterized protein LOC142775470 [Rhipicephalus microplus]|uniref:uncharacterized protein LOC142775470 n=1 Tax=Rhipicephalus microplus TaxID=6941 RepID=UPI003F6D79DF
MALSRQREHNPGRQEEVSKGDVRTSYVHNDMGGRPPRPCSLPLLECLTRTHVMLKKRTEILTGLLENSSTMHQENVRLTMSILRGVTTIRYTGDRDRPLDERQVRFQNARREGQTEIARMKQASMSAPRPVSAPMRHTGRSMAGDVAVHREAKIVAPKRSPSSTQLRSSARKEVPHSTITTAPRPAESGHSRRVPQEYGSCTRPSAVVPARALRRK